MTDFLSNLVLLTIFFISSLPIGYLIFHLLKVGRFFPRNLFIVLPFYAVTGIAGFLLVFFIVSFACFNLWMVIICLVVSILFSLSYFLKKEHSIKAKLKMQKDSILPLLLLLFSLTFFSFVATEMAWAPPGDAVTHSGIVSRILYHQKFPFNYLPYANIAFTLEYPLGFHFFTAMQSLLVGAYPGQSTLLTASLISALLPLVLYSITYTKTRSLFAALFSYSLAFLIPGSFSYVHNHDLLFSNLINGTYPYHLANLLTVAFFGVAICIETLPEEKLIMQPWFKYCLFMALATSVSYYIYSVPVFVYMIVRSISRPIQDLSLILRRHATLRFTAKRTMTFFASLAILIVFASYVYVFHGQSILSFLNRWWLGPGLSSHCLSIEETFINVNGFVLWCSLLFSLVHLMRKNQTLLALSYIFFFSVTLAATNDFIFHNYLWFFSPNRFILVVIAFAYIVVPTSIYTFTRKFHFRVGMAGKFTKLISLHIPVTIVCLMLVYPALQPYFGGLPSNWGRPNSADLEGLEWIVKNTDPDDLILNDRSFPGLFLTSLRAQNVVYPEFLIYLGIDTHDHKLLRRALDTDKLLESPSNYTLWGETMVKWSIDYVYISSDGVFFDQTSWNEQAGGSERYCTRPFTPDTYVTFFDENPHLTAVFRKENVGVYRVEAAK